MRRRPLLFGFLVVTTNACVFFDPFAPLAPDRDLPVGNAPLLDAGNEGPHFPDAVGPRDDAGGTFRTIITLDQGIAPSSGALVWGDIVRHPAGGVVALTSLTATGVDLAVMRIDSSDNVAWLKKLGGAGDDFGHAIAVDANGALWIAGSTTSDPSPFVLGSVATSVTRPFVAKLDSTGTFVTNAPFDTTAVTSGFCHSLTIAADGALYVACGWQGTLAFSTTTGAIVSHTSDALDILFARLDPYDGKVMWNVVYGGTDVDTPWDIASSKTGDLHVAGMFDSPSLSPGNHSRVGTGTNAFAGELDAPNGLASWTRTWGQTTTNGVVRGLAIADGPKGELVFGGDFRGSFDFGAAGKATAPTRSAFIAGLDPASSGAESSLAVLLGATASSIRGIGVDSTSHVVSVGDLTATTPPSIDGHVLRFSPAPSTASGFIVKSATNGTVSWAHSMVASNGVVYPRRVAIAEGDTIHVLGMFSGSLDFGDGITRTASAGGDAFILTLEP